MDSPSKRICLKLINNIQGRGCEVVTNIKEEIVDQKDEKITTCLEYTNKLLIIILDCVDHLENVIVSPDEEGLDPTSRPPREAVESDLFTAELKQQLLNHLPELYEDIKEFIADQFDNINEIKYMIPICLKSSDEKHNTAVEMIEIIESYFDQMEELLSLTEGDDSGIAGREKYEADSKYSEVGDSTYGDDNDYKVQNWCEKYLPDTSYDSGLDRSSLSLPDDSYGLPDDSYGLPDDSYGLPDIPEVPRGNTKFGVHLKKDGTPDRRYKENKPILLKKGETRIHLKKDGTPDRRYKENKQVTKNLTSANRSAMKGPLKKDGTPDKRYSSNKLPMTSTPQKSSTPLKRDGTPDMRFAVNKSSSSSTVSATSTPLKNDGTPDMRYAANKSSGSSRSSCSSGSSISSGPLKNDGTPDMRYAANKSLGSSRSSYSSGSSVSSYGGSISSGPLKRDGTPDMRYAANKSTGSSYSSGSSVSSYGGSISSGPLKRDGTPDMRYAANKSSGSSYSSGSSGSSYGRSSGYYSGSSSSSSYYGSSASSYGGSSSSSSYCPGPTTKSGAPDMRYAANKAYYK